MRRLGKSLERIGKRALGAVADRLPKRSPVVVEDIRSAERVLLVRPNYRIGNTLITTPLVDALRRRFPGARVDYLAGATTTALLQGLAIDRIYPLPRKALAQPWVLWRLFGTLRRERYDVAVEGGRGSFSGVLLTRLTGARYQVGYGTWAERLLNVPLSMAPSEHAYERIQCFARALGVECADRPVYLVSAEERAAARAVLVEAGLVAQGDVIPLVAVFVGGHQDKRWPADRWIALARALSDAGGRLLLALGPEEASLQPRYRRSLPDSVPILPPRSLREFAAVIGAARLVVTPDTGPMHLSAAVGTPTVAVLQQDRSRRYRPRGQADRSLLRPSVEDVYEAVVSHPAWPLVSRRVGPHALP